MKVLIIFAIALHALLCLKAIKDLSKWAQEEEKEDDFARKIHNNL